MNKKALISIFLLLSLMTAQKAFCQDIDEAMEKAATLYNEAIDLYKDNNTDKSIEYFTKALEIKPDFYEAHYNLSQILMSINKNEEALKSLEEIAKLKPDNSENLYNLGKTYYKLGFLSKSYEYLKKINISAPEYDSAKILTSKIEKRQSELNLEEKIKKQDNTIDAKGKTVGVELSHFSAPSGTAIDTRGNIYVASFLENQIYKISIYGQKTVYSQSNLIQGPIGIAMDKNDNLYIANYSANNIVKISPNNIATIFADINKPYCLTYDLEHNRLYVTEQDTNKLIKFDL